MSFLEELKYVRLYFSKNLHAKCYLNESKMIIASMNLYEFSQQNNKEMGILIDRSNEDDKKVYDDAEKEIESIIHNSEDFSYVKAPQKGTLKKTNSENYKANSNSKSPYLTTKELSHQTGISSQKINKWLVDNGYMYKKEEDWIATKKGKDNGGILKDGQYGRFVVWPEEIKKDISE